MFYIFIFLIISLFVYVSVYWGLSLSLSFSVRYTQMILIFLIYSFLLQYLQLGRQIIIIIINSSQSQRKVHSPFLGLWWWWVSPACWTALYAGLRYAYFCVQTMSVLHLKNVLSFFYFLSFAFFFFWGGGGRKKVTLAFKMK